MKTMTVSELCKYLSQFDPDTNVWIVYDSFGVHAPEFVPADRPHGDEIKPGDLVDWEG